MKPTPKAVAVFLAYAACIPLANWFISHVGSVSFPGGPHTIPVGFGYSAPSGVLLIGLALVTRDALQNVAGKRVTLAAIALGVGLSYIVNPALATASAVAFGLSELADFGVYTPLAAKAHKTRTTTTFHGLRLPHTTFVDRTKPVTTTTQHFHLPMWTAIAVMASGVVGAIIDTFVFLQLAFHSTRFWQGQLVGKIAISAITALALVTYSHIQIRRHAMARA